MDSSGEFKRKINELAQSEDIIEGIYNYCDRRCERCRFTTKCLSYVSSPGSNDLSEEETTEYVANNLEATGLMLDEIAGDNDINLFPLAGDEKDPERHEPFRDNLSFSANVIAKETHKWLQAIEPSTGIRKVNSLKLYDEHRKDYHEALEDILYYLFFVAVKLDRAVMAFPGSDDDEYRERNSNGSAKVALIAIDRTLKAWGVIVKERPEYEDPILDIIIKNEKLRSDIEKRFPGARSFIRPGLDE